MAALPWYAVRRPSSFQPSRNTTVPDAEYGTVAVSVGRYP